MDIVDEFLAGYEDDLNPSQLGAIRSSFKKNCIDDYDSIEGRAFDLFHRDPFYEFTDRKRLKCYCRICNVSYSGDKKKFAAHVKTHFTKNDPHIVKVCLFFLCCCIV